jgi:hypothetical protein
MKYVLLLAGRTAVLITVAAMLMSCAATSVQRRPHAITETLSYAERHSEQGRAEEAAQLYQAVLYADPGNEVARAALDEIGKYEPYIMTPSLLGKNRVKRPRREGNALRIVMYPLNRILDILDIVTLQVGLEGGLYAEAHATNALAAGAGAGGGTQIGWSQKRDLSVGVGHVAGISLLPVAVKEQGGANAGTRGADARRYGVAGISRPTDPLFQNYRDYWGVGGRFIALLVGINVEVHPVEAVDAVTGLLFVDFLRDDIGSTKSLNLSDAELDAMEVLMQTR